MNIQNQYYSACLAGNVEQIKLLVQQNIDIHGDWDYGLHLACAKGHWDVIHYLINKGANPNTAFEFCADEEKIDIMKKILKEYTISEESLNLSYQFAVANRDKKMKKYLKEQMVF